MSSGNQYLVAELNMARDYKESLQDERLATITRQNTGIMDLAMLKTFLDYWSTKGFDFAVSQLPTTTTTTTTGFDPITGAPITTSQSTQETVADVNRVSQAILSKPLDQIQASNLNNEIAAITAKVREAIGHQAYLDEAIDGAKAQVDDLVAQEKAEGEARKADA